MALAPRSTLSLITALDLPVVNWDRGERIVAVLVPLSRRAAAADGRDHKRGKENGGGPARHRVIIDMALAKSMPVAFVGLALALSRSPSIGTFWAISVRLPDPQIIDFAHLSRRAPGAFDK